MQIRFLYSDSICKSPYVASLKWCSLIRMLLRVVVGGRWHRPIFFTYRWHSTKLMIGKRHKKWLLQLQCGAYFFIRGIEYFENSKQFYPLFLSNAFHKTNWKFYFDLQLQSQITLPWKMIKILENYNQGFK